MDIFTVLVFSVLFQLFDKVSKQRLCTVVLLFTLGLDIGKRYFYNNPFKLFELTPEESTVPGEHTKGVSVRGSIGVMLYRVNDSPVTS